MKLSIIGGGPAGLYFALLMKNSRPDATIEVVERNRPDDTFGFGVVFSDQTLETLEQADPESFRQIVAQFAWWDDVEIRFKGSVHRIGGNGFCGCSRTGLLALLQQRCRDLGVILRFQAEVDDLDAFADADLIVAADGINSRIREAGAEHFRPSVDLRSNKFAWMGSTCPLDAFLFSFRETEWGVFIAHAYQYEPGRSTWVLETDPETFARAGLGEMDEDEAARLMERVFAEDLNGHPLLTNRSIWRNFPMIRNERWVMEAGDDRRTGEAELTLTPALRADPLPQAGEGKPAPPAQIAPRFGKHPTVVLLGDAKATAHFSIGSGTKLAMEDAIALHDCFQATGSVREALARFEDSRRLEVEKTQHAADVSLVWFEHLRRFWHMDPTRFAFGVMTRSKSITYDNLRLRAPDFVDATDRMFASEVRDEGFDVDTGRPVPPMFQPFRLRGMSLANRVVVSPMCMYSAVDGVPGDWHLVHYGARATGGAGLLFTEMTCVSPEARITPGCTGLWNDDQEIAWKRIVDFVHEAGTGRICLQLGHSGRKGGTRLMWEGMDEPLPEGGWETVSASALPYFPHSPVPREMTRADMDAVLADFVAAADRGARIGFDMLELHAAHGYLLASFLSPLTNRRDDIYGGILENRLRFPLEVFRAMRAAWPAERPMSVRISATDWAEGGLDAGESVAIATAFAGEGCDLIDVSSGQTVSHSRPVYGRMFQTPFSDRIRNEAALATMCVGNITTADQVNTILAAGRADLVALGRPHLADPSFTLKAAAHYGVTAQACPVQYRPGMEQLFRNTAQADAELRDLRIKARPKKSWVG